jgi:hypothetical protein
MVQKQRPFFRSPADENVPVWRYMDLTKFVWMLHNRALYFPNVLTMNDPYEGYYTQGLAPSKESEEIFIRNMCARESGTFSVESEDHRESLRAFYRRFLEGLKVTTELFYVSCWHMNEEESSAMWKLYTSHGDSVCVRSTYQQLSQELPDDCYLGCVNYINYKTDMFDVYEFLNFVVHKRKSFEHEREVRAVINNALTLTATGMYQPPYPAVNDRKAIVVPINLPRLINEVYVSPDAKPPFLDVVQQLISTYGLDVPVNQSEVNAPPAY